MSGVTTTGRLDMLASTGGTSTTTALRPARHGRSNRTVDANRKENVQLLGVRLAHDPRFIAWPSVPERVGVQIRSGYILTVEVDERDAGFAGDALEVASPDVSAWTKWFDVSVAQHHGAMTSRTALGKRLWELRAHIVASGVRLLGWDDIDREIEARRGERNC